MPDTSLAEQEHEKHLTLGEGILASTVVICFSGIIFVAFFFIAEGIHNWHWSSKYAEGFGSMEAQNLRSTMGLCEAFMNPKITPYLGDDQVKQWSTLCMERAEKMRSLSK